MKAAGLSGRVVCPTMIQDLFLGQGIRKGDVGHERASADCDASVVKRYDREGTGSVAWGDPAPG